MKAEDDEDYSPVETQNDESPQRIPYIGELFTSVPDMGSMIMELLFGQSEPTIWEVKRLDWYDEEIDPDTGEWYDTDLIISFEDVLDPTNTLCLSFEDLDMEMDKFVF